MPFGLQYIAGSLDSFDPLRANYRLQEVFRSVSGLWAAAGVLEISYEEVVAGTSYFQPHWHLLVTGPDAFYVAERLREVLPVLNPKNPSVVGSSINNLRGVSCYLAKTIEKGWRWAAEAGDLARRRVIPHTRQRELLVWLHRWTPSTFLLLHNTELTASREEIRIRLTLQQNRDASSALLWSC